jgi:ethanolamine utilization microcompartment shell protein EutL
MDVVQGGYYLATGLWPLIHLRSFLAVSGDKTDRWLVRSYGALTAAIGIALLARESGSVLGPSAAIAIGAPEAWYVARRRIRPVYAVDAAVQAAFVVARRRPRSVI